MKHFFIFILCLIMTLNVKAQDMASFFINMPDQHIPQLGDAWRKDLVDLYQSGKIAELENTMNGRSALQKLTSDYLFLQTTERSTMEIKLLPLINNTFIACVITTVNAPIADSRVKFYTMDWLPLFVSDIWKPADVDWFIKENVNRDDSKFLDAVSYLDMNLIHYHLDEADLVLKAEYTTPNYLSLEEREKVKPFLRENSKVYHWKAGRFEN